MFIGYDQCHQYSSINSMCIIISVMFIELLYCLRTSISPEARAPMVCISGAQYFGSHA